MTNLRRCVAFVVVIGFALVQFGLFQPATATGPSWKYLRPNSSPGDRCGVGQIGLQMAVYNLATFKNADLLKAGAKGITQKTSNGTVSMMQDGNGHFYVAWNDGQAHPNQGANPLPTHLLGQRSGSLWWVLFIWQRLRYKSVGISFGSGALP